MADSFNIGDQVVKNPKTWRYDDYSGWGRGEGIGTIVEPPFVLQPGSVDVSWPTGRCFEYVKELLRADVVEEDNG